MSDTTDSLHAHASWLIGNLRSRITATTDMRKSMTTENVEALNRWIIDFNASISRIMTAPDQPTQDRIYNSLARQLDSILGASTERNAGTNLKQTGKTLQDDVSMPTPSSSDGRGIPWYYWLLAGGGALLLLL